MFEVLAYGIFFPLLQYSKVAVLMDSKLELYFQ